MASKGGPLSVMEIGERGVKQSRESKTTKETGTVDKYSQVLVKKTEESENDGREKRVLTGWALSRLLVFWKGYKQGGT